MAAGLRGRGTALRSASAPVKHAVPELQRSRGCGAAAGATVRRGGSSYARAYSARDPAKGSQLRDGFRQQGLPQVRTNDVLHEATTVVSLKRISTLAHGAAEQLTLVGSAAPPANAPPSLSVIRSWCRLRSSVDSHVCGVLCQPSGTVVVVCVRCAGMRSATRRLTNRFSGPGARHGPIALVGNAEVRWWSALLRRWLCVARFAGGGDAGERARRHWRSPDAARSPPGTSDKVRALHEAADRIHRCPLRPKLVSPRDRQERSALRHSRLAEGFEEHFLNRAWYVAASSPGSADQLSQSHT